MREQHKVWGHVDDQGKVHLPAITPVISKMFLGKDIEVLVKESRPSRTSLQNAYYWAVVVPYTVAGFVAAGNT